MIKRGEIYYADLCPSVGSEQSGCRPVLIVQNDIGNEHSPTTIIVPLTSAYKSVLGTHTVIEKRYGLLKTSIVLAEQIRTIDVCRLSTYVGTVDDNKMKEVNRALKVSLDLV